jgi:ribonuclease P protein component
LGVVAGRKVGRAVQRARARRLLREAFRRHRYLLGGPYDVVLIARRSVLDAPWDELVKELIDLAGKAGILEKPAGAGPGRPG